MLGIINKVEGALFAKRARIYNGHTPSEVDFDPSTAPFGVLPLYDAVRLLHIKLTMVMPVL